jgi:thymidylate synthase (FAD)
MEKSMRKVRIVSLSKPYLPNIDTAEDLISYCARVSNPSNQTNTLTSDKLLRYCIRNQHWSIFEMVHIVVEINTTRDIARQILRHRSFSFQEFSQRYADASQLGFTIREARLQDTKNRQNSIETNDEDLQKAWIMKQEQLVYESKLAYNWAIDNGIAKEQARAVLPEGNTNSRLYVAGTLRSWIHYCQLRMDNGTQKEHREIATECWNILCDQFNFLKELTNQEQS